MTKKQAVDVESNGRSGVLLRAQQSRFGDRVFYCSRGFRHWVMDAQWMVENGFTWPDDVKEVDGTILEAFRPGRRTARRWDASDWQTLLGSTTAEMREICVSRLAGRGVEVGPGASPMPIPLDCDVMYADVFSAEELQQNSYDGQQINDLIVPDLQASLEDLSAIPDASIDFIVACHVIEHTRDPIGSIVRGMSKLKPGGRMALVIPDMTRTFDRARERTPLTHLISDFEDPERERDREHFKEFYRIAMPVSSENYEDHWLARWQEAFPIHYHTWTYESFIQMIEWIGANVHPFSDVWVRPALDGVEDCIEFYCVSAEICVSDRKIKVRTG